MYSIQKQARNFAFLLLSFTSTCYAFHTVQITVPDSVAVSVSDINDSNVLVGYYTVENSFNRGFRYNLNTKRLDKLGTLSGDDKDESFACAINNKGDIVGMSGHFPFHTFILPANSTSMEDISIASAATTKCIPSGITPQKINDSGLIAGWQLFACQNGDDFMHPVCYLNKAESVELKYPNKGGGFGLDINKKGTTVGYVYKAKDGVSKATLWKPGSGSIFKRVSFFPRKKTDSFAWAINDREKVVGSYFVKKNVQQAFSWTSKKGVKKINLRKLKAISSVAKGINNSGVIAGIYSKKPKLYRAFVYKPGVGAYDLGISSAALEYIDVSAINEKGVVLVTSGKKSYAVYTHNLKHKHHHHKRKHH